MNPLLGELAALGTACCWSGGTILFALSGRLIGSYTVNKLRIPIAALLISILLLVGCGTLLPSGLNRHALIYLASSGVIGLAVGDTFYFRCLVILGPRVGALMMSLAPLMTALSAYFMIGERLTPTAVAGIIITLAGVAWVTTDRCENRVDSREGSKAVGIIMGVGGAAAQALGLVLAKEGMAGTFNPLSATLVRMVAATLAIWLVAIARGEVTGTIGAMRNRTAAAAVLGASFLGPTIGVWLSLVAVKNTAAGIAATIMSTFPVLVIPLAMIFHKEKPTWRSVLGAIIAVGGVALLFIRK